MHMTGIRRWLGVCAVVATTTLGVPASAQEALKHKYDPFFDNMVYQSQVYGVEMVGQRLAMAGAFPPPVNPQLVPQLQRMEKRDYARFKGTLALRNPTLEKDLAAALRAVMVNIETSKVATAEITKAQALLNDASKIIVDQTVRDQPAFRGAVLANLLVANDGVAEAFEDAIRENWGFPNGWAALRRVEVLWKDLEPMASPPIRQEMASILDILKTSYYAQPAPKIPFPNEDAEDVEALAHQAINLLEQVTDATLYTGRDMVRLTLHMADVIAPACEAYAKGNKTLGDEPIHAVLDHYRNQIAGALDLLAPELRQQATLLFPKMVEVEYDFYEGFQNLPPDTRDITDAQRCQELKTVFLEAKGALGG